MKFVDSIIIRYMNHLNRFPKFSAYLALFAFAAIVAPGAAHASFYTYSTGAFGNRSWGSVVYSADASVFVGAEPGGHLFVSTNHGLNSNEDSSEGGHSWTSLSASSDGSVLAAAAGDGHIFVATSTADAWTDVSPAGSLAWKGIAVSGSGNLIAAVENAGSIWLSTNNGTSWTEATSTAHTWRSVAVSNTGSEIVAASDDNSILISLDSGATWTNVAPASYQWRSISLSSDGGTLLAGANNDHIMISTTTGATWTDIAPTGTHDWKSVFASLNGSTLLAQDGAGLYISTNGGQTWSLDRAQNISTNIASDKYAARIGIGQTVSQPIIMGTDGTVPVISGIATSTSDTGATITWTTNRIGTSKLAYSPDSTTFASSTTETDVSSPVTSHSKAITGLVPCTYYYAEAVSQSVAGVYATSTPTTFITSGCTAGATPTDAVSGYIDATSGDTEDLSTASSLISVSMPANATTAVSHYALQILSLPASTTLDSIGRPNSLTEVGDTVFEVKALADSGTLIDSFDVEPTVTFSYADDDISSLDVSTLKLYHYHGGSWEMLDGCSTDTVDESVTCNTSGFSLFGLFGSAPQSQPQSQNETASGRSPGGSVQSQVKNLLANGNVAAANALKAQWPQLFGSTTSSTPTAESSTAGSSPTVRDLQFGMTGTDVLSLQKLLNERGFAVAASGPGAPGSETLYFGSRTRTALAKYQQTHGIAPSAGYFGPLTRAQMKGASAVGVWW